MAGMKIRKGDRVRVLTGKDRGREGEVTFAYPAKGRVIVDGLNVAKRHQKPTQSTQQGGIIDKEMPMRVDNVAIICPSCSKTTRIGYRFDTDGTKVRVCKKCGGDL
jgi:large subunit ribosomal protein L24